MNPIILSHDGIYKNDLLPENTVRKICSYDPIRWIHSFTFLLIYKHIHERRSSHETDHKAVRSCFLITWIKVFLCMLSTIWQSIIWILFIKIINYLKIQTSRIFSHFNNSFIEMHQSTQQITLEKQCVRVGHVSMLKLLGHSKIRILHVI